MDNNNNQNNIPESPTSPPAIVSLKQHKTMKEKVLKEANEFPAAQEYEHTFSAPRTTPWHKPADRMPMRRQSIAIERPSVFNFPNHFGQPVAAKRQCGNIALRSVNLTAYSLDELDMHRLAPKPSESLLSFAQRRAQLLNIDDHEQQQVNEKVSSEKEQENVEEQNDVLHQLERDRVEQQQQQQKHLEEMQDPPPLQMQTSVVSQNIFQQYQAQTTLNLVQKSFLVSIPPRFAQRFNAPTMPARRQSVSVACNRREPIDFSEFRHYGRARPTNCHPALDLSDLKFPPRHIQTTQQIVPEEQVNVQEEIQNEILEEADIVNLQEQLKEQEQQYLPITSYEHTESANESNQEEEEEEEEPFIPVTYDNHANQDEVIQDEEEQEDVTKYIKKEYSSDEERHIQITTYKETIRNQSLSEKSNDNSSNASLTRRSARRRAHSSSRSPSSDRLRHYKRKRIYADSISQDCNKRSLTRSYTPSNVHHEPIVNLLIYDQNQMSGCITADNVKTLMQGFNNALAAAILADNSDLYTNMHLNEIQHINNFYTFSVNSPRFMEPLRKIVDGMGELWEGCKLRLLQKTAETLTFYTVECKIPMTGHSIDFNGFIKILQKQNPAIDFYSWGINKQIDLDQLIILILRVNDSTYKFLQRTKIFFLSSTLEFVFRGEIRTDKRRTPDGSPAQSEDLYVLLSDSDQETNEEEERAENESQNISSDC